jgi:hypothetical protein
MPRRSSCKARSIGSRMRGHPRNKGRRELALRHP